MKRGIITILFIALVITGGVIMNRLGTDTVTNASSPTASTTAPINRYDTVKAQIAKMAEDHKKDPGFIAETKRLEAEMEQDIKEMKERFYKGRDNQAYINAVNIYDSQVSKERQDLILQLEKEKDELEAKLAE